MPLLYGHVIKNTPSIPRLHASAQTLFPKAADAVVLAPFLHHPGLELVSDRFPLIYLRRCILLLAALSLDLGLDALVLRSQTLLVEPGSQIFQYDWVVE